MDRERYRRLFLDEARARLDSLERRLAQGAPIAAPAIETLHRDAHSLKGMAAAMSLAPLQELAAAAEELLDSARRGLVPADQALLRALAGAAGRMQRQVEAYATDAPLPEAGEALAGLRLLGESGGT